MSVFVCVCACAFVCLIESIVLKVKGYCAAILAVLPRLFHLHSPFSSACHPLLQLLLLHPFCNAEVSIDGLHAPAGRQRCVHKSPSLKSRQQFCGYAPTWRAQATIFNFLTARKRMQRNLLVADQAVQGVPCTRASACPAGQSDKASATHLLFLILQYSVRDVSLLK